MEAYFIFYFIQLSAIFIVRGFGLKNNNAVLLTLIILATLFAGLRGNIGTDVGAYRAFYDDVGAKDSETVFEPFFLVLSLLGNAAGFSSQFLIFTAAAAQGLFVYLAIRHIKEKDYFYLLFVATFFVHLQMNIIRVGVALCILAYALVLNEEQRKLAIPVLLASVLTHVTAAFAFILFSRRWYRALPLAILAVVAFQDFFLSKIQAYFIGTDIIKTSNDYVGFGFLASLAVIAYCITVEQKWMNRAIRVSFIAFALFKIAIPLLPAFDRISLVFSLPLFLLLLRSEVQVRTRLALILLIAYNTYGSLSFIANSDASLEALIAEFPGFALLYADTHWLPYEFFWN